MATRWQDLTAWGQEDERLGLLSDLLEARHDMLRHIETPPGSDPVWQNMYLNLTADDEEPSWDTPHGEVDWTGFADALNEVRRQHGHTDLARDAA